MDINDIVSLFDGQCTCKLYADDMKLYTVFHAIDFQPHFQQCLDILAKWSDAWQLNISCKNCAIMNISHTRNNSVTDVSYHIKSNPVPTVKTIQDLGVTVENNLKFSSFGKSQCDTQMLCVQRSIFALSCFYSVCVPVVRVCIMRVVSSFN